MSAKDGHSWRDLSGFLSCCPCGLPSVLQQCAECGALRMVRGTEIVVSSGERCGVAVPAGFAAAELSPGILDILALVLAASDGESFDHGPTMREIILAREVMRLADRLAKRRITPHRCEKMERLGRLAAPFGAAVIYDILCPFCGEKVAGP